MQRAVIVSTGSSQGIVRMEVVPCEGEVGSPSKFEMMEYRQKLLRSKFAHQQRLATASQLMASSNFPLSPMAANKCMNFLLQQ